MTTNQATATAQSGRLGAPWLLETVRQRRRYERFEGREVHDELEDLVTLIESLEHERIEAESRQLEAMTALRELQQFRLGSAYDASLAHDAVVAEIALARRVPRARVEAELSDGHTLFHHLRLTCEALDACAISVPHARAIAHAAEPLVNACILAQSALERAVRQFEAHAMHAADVGSCACEHVDEGRLDASERVVHEALELLDRYEHGAVKAAARFSVATTRARCEKLAARLTGASREERMREARCTRAVRVFDLGDGIMRLSAELPSVEATAIHDRLTQMASALRRNADETRTFDQLRADVLADLLLTAEPSAVHASARGIDATVCVTVPVLTAIGVDTEAATLNGTIPIPLDVALRLAAGAPSWLRVLTDPVTGVVREAESYRVPKALRALLDARDATCRFPGCRRPARRCDIDHVTAWSDGGATSADNLENLCQRDHSMKHATAWRVERHHTERSALTWISPAGRRYDSHPPPVGPEFTPSEIARLRGDPHEPPPF